MLPDHPQLRGAICAILASLMFASMGLAVRYASMTLSTEMIVFLRNIFGLLCLTPWIIRAGPTFLKTTRLRVHIVRSLSGLAAMYCFFLAIPHLQLAEAVLLNFSAPLFMPLLALLILHEKSPRSLLLAIGLGFIGVCFILKPGTGLFNQAALIGLASGMFAALSMVTIRNLSITDPIMRTVIYYSIISTLVSALPAWLFWQVPDNEVLLLMLFAGIAATLGQIFLTYSYSLAPASRIGPYTYSTVIFAAMYGWYFWNEIPDIWMIIGAIMICFAGVMALQRRAKLQLT